MAKWAETTDIASLVGVTVTEATRNLAAQSIEMHTGLIEAVARPAVSGRDLYWLKLAVCYQAAWITAQPDYLERLAVSSASQDGQSATAANPEWLTLAPLARKAIKRLSWRGTRTRAAQGERPRIVNVNDDDYEDSLPGWSTV